LGVVENNTYATCVRVSGTSMWKERSNNEWFLSHSRTWSIATRPFALYDKGLVDIVYHKAMPCQYSKLPCRKSCVEGYRCLLGAGNEIGLC
jgi:hypothetical protein